MASPEQIKIRDDILQGFSIEAANVKEHCWISIVTMKLTDEACRALVSGGPEDMVTLDGETSMVGMDAGCINCEMAFKPGLIGTVCLGDAVKRA